MKFNLLENFSSFFPHFPEYIIIDIIKSLKNFNIIGIKVTNDKKVIGKININITTIGDFNIKRTFVISNINNNEIEEKIIEQKYNSSSVITINWNKNGTKTFILKENSFKGDEQYLHEESIIYEKYWYDKKYVLTELRQSKTLFDNQEKNPKFDLETEPEYFYNAIYNVTDDKWYITTSDYECIINGNESIERAIEYKSILNEMLQLYSELKKENKEDILNVAENHLVNIRRRKRTFN